MTKEQSASYRTARKRDSNDTAMTSVIAGTQRWREAYDDFATAMKLDPSRSWTRQRAEEARDRKLNIIRPYQKPKRKK